ncbi:L-xylulose reductase-like isoform X3 [Mytilus galloprovincialis]|uniref:L-xylulose reductase-like isoform X3 n=1 Tax=Mytilus galloprovincialis TaxID=29158 RepID=UPI003F7C7611
MAMQFDGKRALVTGAGKGFGRAIAKKLAECGAETFALSRTQADLDSLKSEVPNIKVINVDLQDWDKTREEVSKIGHIDLLVNNAGVFKKSSFIDTPKENIDMIFDINFKGIFNVSQIRVNSVNPTVVLTDMTRQYQNELMPLLALTPMGRFPGKNKYNLPYYGVDRYDTTLQERINATPCNDTNGKIPRDRRRS